MKISNSTLTAAAFVLATGIGQTHAQQSSEDGTMHQDQQGRMMHEGQQGGSMQQGAPGMMGSGMMGSGMMGRGMMGEGMMHRGMGSKMGGHMGGHMGHGAMMPILFAIMDADGDGALTLEEIQEIHARIFAHMDADGNGKLTPDEIKDFVHGGRDADASEE